MFHANSAQFRPVLRPFSCLPNIYCFISGKISAFCLPSKIQNLLPLDCMLAKELIHYSCFEPSVTFGSPPVCRVSRVYEVYVGLLGNQDLRWVFVLCVSPVPIYTIAHLSASDLACFVLGSTRIPWRERAERTSGENVYLSLSVLPAEKNFTVFVKPVNCWQNLQPLLCSAGSPWRPGTQRNPGPTCKPVFAIKQFSQISFFLLLVR